MKVKIVYFAYLVPNVWQNIVIEQLDALKQLELYSEAVNIYISVIADDIELEKLKTLISSEYTKLEIINHYYENVFEYPGIKTVYDISNENEDDTVILYFHSKGMTSHADMHRQNLFKMTITPYRKIINEFEKNENLDVASFLPHPNGFAYFNFFWTRSSYVRKWLVEPTITENRYIWEVWLGIPYSKKEKVVTYSPFLEYNTITTEEPAFGYYIDNWQ